MEKKSKNNGVKDSFFFRHDSNARHDTKILKLRMKYGGEGYGIYWMILEKMREENDFAINFEDISEICYDFRCEEDLLLKILNDFNLFYQKDSKYFSSRFLRDQNWYKSLRDKRITAGRKGGIAKSIASGKAVAMPEQCSGDDKALLWQSPSQIVYDRIGYDRIGYDNVSPKKPSEISENSLAWKCANLLKELLEKRERLEIEPNLGDWAIVMQDLLNRHDVRLVVKMIRWSQAHEFWRKSILSAEKFRQKFFKLVDDSAGQSVTKDGIIYQTPNNEDEFGNAIAVV